MQCHCDDFVCLCDGVRRDSAYAGAYDTSNGRATCRIELYKSKPLSSVFMYQWTAANTKGPQPFSTPQCQLLCQWQRHKQVKQWRHEPSSGHSATIFGAPLQCPKF